jgi:hypothetical protein
MNQRLFYGSIIVVADPDINDKRITTTTMVEHCISWANSEEECLGAWVKKVQEKHPEPNKSIRKTFIYDCTEYARSGFEIDVEGKP